MINASIGKIASLGDAENGFAVIGIGTKMQFSEILNPNTLGSITRVAHDGDILIINHLPADKPEPYRRPHKKIVLLHRDRDGHASHTPLAEIPPGGPLIPCVEGIRPLSTIQAAEAEAMAEAE